MKRLLILLPILLYSCSTTRHVQMQVAEHIHKDMVYLRNIQYESIYIYKDKSTGRSRDTLYIKELQAEYRYKYLRDTVIIVQRDSIPYEIRIVETKEIPRLLTLYDHITRSTFWLLLGFIAIYILAKLK